MTNYERLTDDLGFCPFNHPCHPECALFNPKERVGENCTMASAYKAAADFFGAAHKVSRRGNGYVSIFTTTNIADNGGEYTND